MANSDIRRRFALPPIHLSQKNPRATPRALLRLGAVGRFAFNNLAAASRQQDSRSPRAFFHDDMNRSALRFFSILCLVFGFLCALASEGYADETPPSAPTPSAARAQAIFDRLMLAAGTESSGNVRPALTLAEPDEYWPADSESYAYELSHLDGTSSIRIQRAWLDSASDSQAAFVLGHETAHALCAHRLKSIGAYGMISKAVGASLWVLAQGADSDATFRFAMLEESASMELEADVVGAALAQAAGFSGRQGLLEALAGSPGGESHPSGAERIALADRALNSPMSARHRLQQCLMREHDAY